MSEAWKNLERDVARLVGGKRHLRGADFGQSASDVDLPDSSPFGGVECKLRKHLPKLLADGLEQARRHAKDGKPALLVVKEKGSHRRLAVLDFEDLVKLLNGKEEPHATPPPPSA